MSSVPQNVIKHKVWLLNLAAELGNVARACMALWANTPNSLNDAPA